MKALPLPQPHELDVDSAVPRPTREGPAAMKFSTLGPETSARFCSPECQRHGKAVSSDALGRADCGRATGLGRFGRQVREVLEELRDCSYGYL